ncbi:MAG: polar amino acid transport system substrate-binding protein [Psychromonas sp.]|jgi:polar amino acid transport system substrate-binding protein|uniref:substrate-binding periplasmic protein n=1 Tax=Psychromonas sp. TaxID=1884585 RepID=UPI0039E4436C
MGVNIRYIISYLIVLLCFSMPAYTQSKPIDDIYFITENYPPFNFEENGKLQGISIDLLLLMLNKLHAKQTLADIHLKPWARGYNALLANANTCLFSTLRTEEREKLFKWVGPISAISISLIARKDKNIQITSKQDLLKYKIGVVRDDAGEQLLLKAGVAFENLDQIGGVNVIAQSIRKLNKGRFDLLAYGDQAAIRTMKKQGFDFNNYEIVYSLKKGEIYYACNKEMSELLIQGLQNALDALKKEGIYQQILDNY